MGMNNCDSSIRRRPLPGLLARLRRPWPNDKTVLAVLGYDPHRVFGACTTEAGRLEQAIGVELHVGVVHWLMRLTERRFRLILILLPLGLMNQDMMAVNGDPMVAWIVTGLYGNFCHRLFGRHGCKNPGGTERWRRHSAEVGLGVGADVGEAGGIGHAGGLAGVGVGPALALLEFGGVIVQQRIDWD